MQADADAIDAWWRAQDATRAPRNDVSTQPCGIRLDLSVVRLSRSSAELAAGNARFPTIANELIARGFSSRYTKYVVYYDGPADPHICGQGGGEPAGIGYAIVYVRACAGVPPVTTAAHELIHAFGAVPDGAPNMCLPPDDGHVCDDPWDLMFPYGDETPITRLTLDTGRDDYYGHSGGWADLQDSPWLVQLDRQVPFAITIQGRGSIEANVPGLNCGESCTTTWSSDTDLALLATPAAGDKLVRWGGSCSGNLVVCNVKVAAGSAVSAVFAPSRYRLALAVSGRGVVRSSSRPGIACSARCRVTVESHRPIRLISRAAPGWRLASWQGACKGATAVCTLSMTGNTSARAVFVRR